LRKSSKRKRSAAARKGWNTRRRNAQREFRKRSKASKKGWRRRKAKAAIVAKAKAQPKAKGPLREWQVVWKYLSGNREVTFDVIAKSEEDAKLFVVKAVARRRDSQGADLTWMTKIPWDEVSAIPGADSEEEQKPLNRREIMALGEGWVAKR
jgi:hypothetical protein